MRLIDTSTLRLVSKQDGDVPPYAILSHTWGADDDEVTFQEFAAATSSRIRQPNGLFPHRVSKKPGFAKVRDSARLAKSQGYQYIWVDTCCINKSSSAELSEAINSMFRWYREAGVCYAYLNDVDCLSLPDVVAQIQQRRPAARSVLDEIYASRWFTRGWTLQELIAPADVEFYSCNWSLLGTRLGGDNFVEIVSEITGIDRDVLDRGTDLDERSVASRMKWAARRRTTRIEDQAYCLMGIFSVNMPLLYGEGSRAFIRLQEEILKATDDQSIFAWKCPEEDPLRYQLSGLLALSPSYFQDSGYVRPLERDTSRASAPSTMTNVGLHVSLFLRRRHFTRPRAIAEQADPDGGDREAADYLAILDCAPYRGEHGFYRRDAIRLMPLGGDQYARIDPEITYSMSLAEITEPAGGDDYKYIYVKQLPAYGLPDIVMSPNIYRERDLLDRYYTTPSGRFALTDIYPRSNWNPQTKTLKSSNIGQNNIFGAFRYVAASALHTEADVFIGLSPRKDGPRAQHFWCFQQLVVPGEPLEESVSKFSLQNDVEKKQQQEHGLEGVVAAVKMQRVQNRTNIHLSLTSAHMLHATSRSGYYLPNGLNELEDTSLAAPQFLLRIAEQPTTPDTWEASLGVLPNGSTHSRATRRIRIRPQQEASKPTFAEILELARGSEVMIDDDPAGNADDDPFRKYFSMLLVKACKKNDVKAATELLDSPLSTAVVETTTSMQAIAESPTWHAAFNGFRPIHWAAALGHREIIRALLERGADVESTTRCGLSASHLALVMGHADLLQEFNTEPVKAEVPEDEVFEKSQARDSLAHLAASYIRSDSVRPLLERLLVRVQPDGTQLITNDIRNERHETPLHRAAAMDNTVAAEAIVSMALASDINVVDDRDRTPLFHAAAAGAVGTLNLLLSHLANLESRDIEGRTALHAACLEGHTEVVEILLDAGSDMGGPTTAPTFSALHCAALAGSVDTIRLLLNRGADPSCLFEVRPGRPGVAPIHIVAANGRPDCVKILCEAGSDRVLAISDEHIYYSIRVVDGDHEEITMDTCSISLINLVRSQHTGIRQYLQEFYEVESDDETEQEVEDEPKNETDEAEYDGTDNETWDEGQDDTNDDTQDETGGEGIESATSAATSSERLTLEPPATRKTEQAPRTAIRGPQKAGGLSSYFRRHL
ncbi:ankyrin [Thozetella sp. PMI_491]|nr:ankyrin [Thozetella sp. PMI_491]